MNKKEEIIIAVLDLAAEKGLGSVSMSQIAEKMGMRKPSLYNQFSSKEVIIKEMYVYLRERAKQQLPEGGADIGEMIKSGRSTYEVLLMSVTSYAEMNGDETMQKFYKVIYSQRAVDPAAAQIISEETRKMIGATKAMFYALQAHGKIKCTDIDMAAFSFAMTVHSILDYILDCKSSGQQTDNKILTDYIKWYCEQLGGL